MYKKHNSITLHVWVTILELQFFTEIAIQLFFLLDCHFGIACFVDDDDRGGILPHHQVTTI